MMQIDRKGRRQKSQSRTNITAAKHDEIHFQTGKLISHISFVIKPMQICDSKTHLSIVQRFVFETYNP